MVKTIKKSSILLVIIILASCTATETPTVVTPATEISTEVTSEEVTSAAKTPTTEISTAKSPTTEPLNMDYEKITEEALNNEHKHEWIENGFNERHPHEMQYICECGATGTFGDKFATYTMDITGPSKEHPHNMIRMCSYCNKEIEDENLPTKLTWLLHGYESTHPHHAIIKCSQCDYTYIEKNITAMSNDVAKMSSTTSEEKHPHKRIFECTYKGCDHTLIFDDETADFELKTDPYNYGIAHPHYLFGMCDYNECGHQEALSEMTNWTWKDGVCSICGKAHHVLYSMNDGRVEITGLVTDTYPEDLKIPDFIEDHPVVIIGESAFRYSDSLKYVTLGVNIQEIRSFAFEGCVDLVQVIITAPVAPIIGEEVFARDTIIIIPVGAIGYEGQEWEHYNVIIQEEF